MFLSLLVAMDVVLNRFLSFDTDILRVSFGFIPQSFSAILFGPLVGGISSAIADIIGMIIAPKGPYFPGLTLSSLLTGIIYGLFLYKKPKTLPRITLAVLFIVLFVDLGLNTYWLTILWGKGYLLILPTRVIKSLLVLPVQVSSIYLLWRYAGNFVEKNMIYKLGRI